MENITPLSGYTQTQINAFIDHCITQGMDITPVCDRLTKGQLIAFINTTHRASIETQLQVRSLAKPLVAFLYELGKIGKGHYREIRDKVKTDYNMTVNDYSSLRYWGLITPVIDDGSPANGYWKITETGKQFLAGEISLPSKVDVHNNRVIKKGENLISITDFDVMDWRGYHSVNKLAIGNYDYDKVLDILLS